MATSTDKLAPRIIINENDISMARAKERKPPVTLIFGFAPKGRTCEMVECNTLAEITQEFGSPDSSPEKYFIDAGLRMVQSGATAIMTRLPYDNDQSHNVKYVDYKLEDAIALSDIYTVPMETKMRQKDNVAVSVLKEMHGIDPTMTQVQRISQVVDERDQTRIHSMANEKLVELELDPKANLDTNTFRIVDIVGEQYGIGAGKVAYVGVFPIITTATMALYYQGKIKNTKEYDSLFNLVTVEHGIEMSGPWYKMSNPIEDQYKMKQAEIISSITQQLNFDTSTNRFHRADSFQDMCVKRFPMLKMVSRNKIEKQHLKDIGILICKVAWDNDQQITRLEIAESFVGKLGNGRDAIDRKINSQSKMVRMYKNLSISNETDFFVINDQTIASIGMTDVECQKFINYKTSIVDPITYMLESTYSDIDSVYIDTILDAGLSSTAFFAHAAQNENGETFKENEKVRVKVNWTKAEFPPDEYVDEYADVWNEMTHLVGDFVKNVRGDCVYIADGPRILNLERNYPISNYIDMDNMEMFNKFLPLFNGNTNNYVARYWNWVYMEDMQYIDRGLWVPGSVVMGSQLSSNDKVGQVWYAPAGQTRGIVPNAYDVSVRTKGYNQENDLLYQNNWNFFQIYQNEGVVVEGQRTLQTKKTALDRLNVRRMVCWIKQQARMIANRYKYEPHTTTTREGFRRDLESMLMTIQKTNGISDYRIVCDTTNNSIESIDRHELHCKMAIKPIKAVEYIIIDLNLLNGSISFDDTTVALQ